MTRLWILIWNRSGFGTFTARGLSGSDSEGLGWHPHGSLHPQFLVLCPLDEVSADLFEALHVAGGQGNPNTMNRAFLSSWLGILVHRHVQLSVRVLVFCPM